MTAEPLQWSTDFLDRRDVPPAPAGQHVHYCACGSYAYCSTPLDQCDEDDICGPCTFDSDPTDHQTQE